MFSVITLLRDGHMLHQVKLQIEYGLMNRKKYQRQTSHTDQHNVPTIDALTTGIKHCRNQETALIKSPKLSHSDLCRLADQIPNHPSSN